MRTRLVSFHIKLFRQVVVMALVFGMSACLPIPQRYIDVQLPPAHYHINPSTLTPASFMIEGYPEPNTPSRYNRSQVLRYSAPELDTPAANTLIVMMPGIFGGAMSLDIVARHMVAASQDLEVWIVDRRANLLEDRTPTLEALAAHDPSIAYEAYISAYNQSEGYQEHTYDELSFVNTWGLTVHLYDLHQIIRAAHEVTEHVVLLGHSLGASLVSYYAAFYVEDSPCNRCTGQDWLDGLVLVDGVLGRTGGFDGIMMGLLEVAPNKDTPAPSSLNLQDLLHIGPYLNIGFTPREYAYREAVAVLAYLDPAGLSPLYDFPVTNEAAFGLLHDDHFEATPIFSSSLGDAVSADYSGNLLAVLLSGLEGVYSRSVEGVAAGASHISWTRGDPQREHSDIRDYMKLWLGATSNFNEWYFPVPLMLDIAGLDLKLAHTSEFIPTAQVTVPTLGVGASRGLVTTPEAFAAYNNARAGSLFSSYILPGLTHLDIISAEANPLVPLMQRWLEQLGALD